MNALTQRLQAGTILLWLRRLCPPVLLVLVLAIAASELRGLDFGQLKRTTAGIDTWLLLLLTGSGMAAVAVMSAYDLIITRALQLKIPVAQVFRYAWVANTFSNIAGVAGLTGSGIRFLALSRSGVNTATISHYVTLVVLSTPLGLAFLALLSLPSVNPLLVEAQLPAWFGYVVLAAIMLYLPGFLLFERLLPSSWRPETVERPNLPLKAALLCASMFEWLCAAAVLWLSLWLLNASLPPLLLLAAFSIAATLGLASFLPGGLGVFDGTLIVLLATLGVATETALTAVVLFRACYYLVPWLLGVQWGADLLALQEPQALRRLTTRLKRTPLLGIIQIPADWLSTLGVRVLSWVTLSAGILLLLSSLYPALGDRALVIREFVPLVALETSHIGAAMIGTLLIGLSRGIAAQTRRAYRLTQILLTLGAVLILLKGLGVETSLYLVAVIFLLWARRKDFRRSTFPIASRQTLTWLLVLLAATAGYLIFGSLIYDDNPLLGLLTRFDHALDRPRIFRAGLVVCATSLGLVAWTAFTRTGPHLQPATTDELTRARDVLQHNGSNTFSHLVFVGDKQVLLTANDEAFVQFGMIGDRMIALGDPVGSPDRLRDAIMAFQTFADDRGCTPVFYEVDEDHLHLYHDLGFAAFKLGEQAVVDLAKFTLRGRHGGDFRHAINHAQREGMVFELCAPPFSDTLWTELLDISHQWLGGRAEKGFSLGPMQRHYLELAPVALVRHGERIVAFASIVPAYGPSREMSVDLMRHRSDAPKGTMDFLFVNLLMHAKETNHATFDLGIAPLSGVGDHANARGVERWMRLAFEHGNIFYNYKGLRAFKEKFRPQWRSVYLAYPYTAPLRRVMIDSAALVAGGYFELFRRK